uniref:Uncharacterized protein n=1 Tax=Anguilla anguilla TaxID=7936 RepID=A0A0E9W7E2_ANGAN
MVMAFSIPALMLTRGAKSHYSHYPGLAPVAENDVFFSSETPTYSSTQVIHHVLYYQSHTYVPVKSRNMFSCLTVFLLGKTVGRRHNNYKSEETWGEKNIVVKASQISL